jgi:putative transposase
MNAAYELVPIVGVLAACAALAVSRATFYRRRSAVATCAPKRAAPARALSSGERQAVLDVASSERFVDTAPAEIVATLLDEEKYLGSVRTFYRVLASAGEVRERRDQLRHPEYKKPELLATAPNQVWTWDITKLLGPEKWKYFYLYVVIDIFSRYVVGWLLAEKENATLAKRLISETCKKQEIEEGQLTIHGDRGAPMTSKTLAQLMADLTITKSHSRPQVSNDNPFSESPFKTMKYQPEYPDRFSSLGAAGHHSRQFFDWYNDEHRHSGIAFLTPADVHFGRATQVVAARQATLDAAFAAHPERFVGRAPRAALPSPAVWINPPVAPEKASDASDSSNPHVSNGTAIPKDGCIAAETPLTLSDVLSNAAGLSHGTGNKTASVQKIGLAESTGEQLIMPSRSEFEVHH